MSALSCTAADIPTKKKRGLKTWIIDQEADKLKRVTMQVTPAIKSGREDCVNRQKETGNIDRESGENVRVLVNHYTTKAEYSRASKRDILTRAQGELNTRSLRTYNCGTNENPDTSRANNSQSNNNHHMNQEPARLNFTSIN